MEKLADISAFENITGNPTITGNQVFVSNRILERLFPNPSYENILSGAGMAEHSRQFLGDREKDEIPLAYQKHLTSGGWEHGLRSDDNVKKELMRGRGVGKSLHSLFKGMELLIKRYIEHTAPEVQYVQETLLEQKKDILHFIGFLRNPIVRKQMGLSRTNYKDVEMLANAYIQKMKEDVRNQVIEPLDRILREVRENVDAAKPGIVQDLWNRIIWDRIPSGLRDIIFDNRLAKHKLSHLPKEDKKREYARYLKEKTALRDEAEFMGDSTNEEVFGFTKGDGSYADQAAAYYLKSIGSLPGRFGNKDGKGGNNLYHALKGNGYANTITQRIQSYQDALRLVGGDKQLANALWEVSRRITSGKAQAENNNNNQNNDGKDKTNGNGKNKRNRNGKHKN